MDRNYIIRSLLSQFTLPSFLVIVAITYCLRVWAYFGVCFRILCGFMILRYFCLSEKCKESFCWSDYRYSYFLRARKGMMIEPTDPLINHYHWWRLAFHSLPYYWHTHSLSAVYQVSFQFHFRLRKKNMFLKKVTLEQETCILWRPIMTNPSVAFAHSNHVKPLHESCSPLHHWRMLRRHQNILNVFHTIKCPTPHNAYLIVVRSDQEAKATHYHCITMGSEYC